MKQKIKLMNLDSYTGNITSFQDYLNSKKKTIIKKDYIKIPNNFPPKSLLDIIWDTPVNYIDNDYFIIEKKDEIIIDDIDYDDLNYLSDDLEDEDFNTDNSYFYDE